jgi:hypothetical protein
MDDDWVLAFTSYNITKKKTQAYQPRKENLKTSDTHLIEDLYAATHTLKDPSVGILEHMTTQRQRIGVAYEYV